MQIWLRSHRPVQICVSLSHCIDSRQCENVISHLVWWQYFSELDTACKKILNAISNCWLTLLLVPQGSWAGADKETRAGARRAERRPQQGDAEHAVRFQQSPGTAQRQDLRPSDTVCTHFKNYMPLNSCTAADESHLTNSECRSAYSL